MLCIVGTAQTIMAAPYDDDKFEIWSVAQAISYPAFKRWDVLYEMHTEGYWRDPNVLKRLSETKGVPLVMHDQYDEIPTSVRYPIEEMVSKYRRYHTTSITYMLVWALHSFLTTGKPQHLSLCGVHMEAREEYTVQRPACEYWLARLEQAGVDIQIAGGAILAAQGLYGYENYDPLCWKFRQLLNNYNGGIQVRAQEESDAELKKHQQIGAAKAIEALLRQAQTGELMKFTPEEKEQMAGLKKDT